MTKTKYKSGDWVRVTDRAQGCLRIARVVSVERDLDGGYQYCLDRLSGPLGESRLDSPCFSGPSDQVVGPYPEDDLTGV